MTDLLLSAGLVIAAGLVYRMGRRWLQAIQRADVVRLDPKLFRDESIRTDWHQADRRAHLEWIQRDLRQQALRKDGR